MTRGSQSNQRETTYAQSIVSHAGICFFDIMTDIYLSIS